VIFSHPAMSSRFSEVERLFVSLAQPHGQAGDRVLTERLCGDGVEE
jgi:hypothetical protein